MPKTIALRHIDYSVEHKHLLEDVSFTCTDNEKLCIFGENGVGKSTLMKIICGQIEADDGSIEKQGFIRFVYVPQEFQYANSDITIENYILQNTERALLKKVFQHGVRFGYNLENNKGKLCRELSGGQQKILALSTAFASSPDFLLLDEPENHLDIVSRQVLVEFMKSFRGGIIFISHDRMIIDSVVTKIGELANGTVSLFGGDYNNYIESKLNRLAGEQRTFDAEIKRIKQLQSALVIAKQKAIRGKETAAYNKIKDEIDTLKEKHSDGRPKERQSKISICTNTEKVHSGKLIFSVKKASFSYPENIKKLFSHINLEIRTGEKIVLLGRNGIGKTTFLKCLTGQLEFSTGEAAWAKNVKVEIFNQHTTFPETTTPFEIISDELNTNDEQTRAILGSMKFDLQRMETPVKLLSGGERMRVRFALVFGKKPDFIILDEPTNHIDEITWEILLSACKETTSSLLLVTHDYEFISSLCPTKYWVIHNQKLEEKSKELDELLEQIQN